MEACRGLEEHGCVSFSHLLQIYTWYFLSYVTDMYQLCRELALDRKQTTILEEYWERSRARDASSLQAINKDSPLTSPVMSFNASRASPRKGHARNRSASDAGALIPPGHRLSPFHPAWSLTTLLDTFGPLIFPIHRAALLRKRILISTHAPVHETCNFGKFSWASHTLLVTLI